MSSESPQQQAASDAARTNSALQQRLAGAALPEISQLSRFLQGSLSDLNAGGLPGAGDIRQGINSDFDRANKANTALIGQRAAQSGETLGAGQVSSMMQGSAIQLEQQRQQSLRNFQMQQAQAQLGEFNSLVGMLGGASGAALNLGGGFAGQQLQGIGGMSQQSQFGSVLGGAASGAALGTSISPGYGTAIGAVAGGLAGWLSSGG